MTTTSPQPNPPGAGGPVGPGLSRYDQLRAAFAVSVPLLVIFALVIASARQPSGTTSDDATPLPEATTGPAKSLTVVVILDSLREQNGRDAVLMPRLVGLNERALHGPMRSCAANFTLPCLLTSFEGRASPFVTAVTNFSGKATGNPNWFEALRRDGLRVGTVADHTLPELYPTLFNHIENFESLDVPLDDRDAFAYDQTLAWVRSRTYDTVVAHIVGTDKVAHAYRPGSPEYIATYQAADAFVGKLIDQLDLTRDTLVVFGDHGHGPEGHHERTAWYAVAGPGFATRELAVEQTSFLYLLSRISGVALPATYEGEHLWQARPEDPSEEPWRQRQASVYGVNDPSRASLDAERAAYRETLSAGPRRTALEFFPWWLSLVFVISAAAQHLNGAPLRKGWTRFQLGWMVMATWLPTWPIAWLALPLQLALSRPVKGFRRPHGLLLAVSAAALVSGLLIPTIVLRFHILDSGTVKSLTWFGLTAAIPLLVGMFAVRTPTGPKVVRGALAALGVSTFLAGPGVYYYGAAQGLCHLLFPVVLVSLLALPGARRAFRSVAVWQLLVAATGVVFALISAGGWEWHFSVHVWLRIADPALWTIVGLACALLVTVVPSEARHRTGWVALASAAIYIVLEQHLAVPLPRVAALAWLVLAIVAATSALERAAEDPRHSALARAVQSALFAGGLVLALWSVTDGFYLKNLSLDFALRIVGTWFSHERDLAIAAAIIVMTKYLTITLPLLAAAAAALGYDRFGIVARGAILILAVKLLAQCLQFVGVQFVEEEKSSELILQEAVGVTWTLLNLSAFAVGSSVARHARQWTLGKTRVS